MPDLLDQASAWLEDMRNKHASRMVTYQRGQQSVPVAASIGKTLFSLDDGGGAIIEIESRDYLILAQDLAIRPPQRGDRIVEEQDGHGIVYEVVPFGSEPCWRWSDLYRRTMRVHTKAVAK